MENQPSLIMSSLDVARLDRLLESPACAHQPGIDALRGEVG
ncbi:UNVERIFIED_CONTAM: nucleoside diphosphate kinase regulator, partial [Salmonella enterica subsp. enterica serovar Weltevreden]